MSMTIANELRDQAFGIVVQGEVDVSNADDLRATLGEALASDKPSVEVDLSGVSYIDSTGIGVLVGAAHHCADEGKSLVVVRPQRNVARVLAMLGVSEELGIKE